MNKLSFVISGIVAMQFLLCSAMPRDWYYYSDQYCRFRVSFRHPPAFCLTNECSDPPQHFTVHAIRLIGERTINRVLPDRVLEDYKDKLLIWWPDLKSGDDFTKSKQYRKDSYNVSGHYDRKIFYPKEYIELGVTLGERYGYRLIKILKAHGIVPSESEGNPPMEIGDAIRKEFNRKPEITCVKVVDDDAGDENDVKERFYLYQIRLCFNNDKVMIDCFNGRPNYCPNVDKAYFAI